MQIANDTDECNGSEQLNYTEPLSQDYALAALRIAAARVRLLVADLDMIGLGLRDGLVSPEGALLWCRDLGVLELIGGADFEQTIAFELQRVAP